MPSSIILESPKHGLDGADWDDAEDEEFETEGDEFDLDEPEEELDEEDDDI
jgi:hypothetical protein